LASKTQQSTTEPEFYQYSPTVSTVCRLLNQQHAKKATGLDKIPCKLLTLYSSIVGSSLAYIFKSCIDAEIFSDERKIAKVTPLFKKGFKRETGNYRAISVSQKCSIKLFIINFMINFRIKAVFKTYQSGFQRKAPFVEVARSAR